MRYIGVRYGSNFTGGIRYMRDLQRQPVQLFLHKMDLALGLSTLR
jgi:hypothetical protein